MKPYVFVLNKDNEPLMPSKRIKHAHKLVKEGFAETISRTPFIIKLKYQTLNITQPLHLGIDPGRTNVGVSVISDKGVVFMAKVETRNKDIPKLMTKRKMYRQNSRRGERLRRKRRAEKNNTTMFDWGWKELFLPHYEKSIIVKDIKNSYSRYLNRKRPEGWLTPTVNQLIEAHVNLVKKLQSFIPIADCSFEMNKFAFMKLDDDSVRGTDFQNGRMKNYASVDDYVYARQEGKCFCCGGAIEHYHHIIPRHLGGSDLPENKAGLCNPCHDKIHLGKIKLSAEGIHKKYGSLSVLNQAIPYITEQLKLLFNGNLHLTTGYETQELRKKLNLPKDHHIDALCIAMNGSGVRPDLELPHVNLIKQFRRHDRAIINNQRERTYYLNGKAIAKNRHKRFEQTGDSLEEFAVNNPDKVSKLTVKKSTRSYNNPYRVMPGAKFLYEGKEYTLTGQITNGAYYKAYGSDRNFPAKKCKIIEYNKGLVFVS